MTIQEKLKVVEEQIRKDIPRLMELTPGCRILEKEYDEFYKIDKIIRGNFVLYGENNTGHKFVNKILQSHYEVIGHDILLTDMLEWLGGLAKSGKMGKVTGFYLSNEGVLTRKNQDGSYDFICEIDLSKPQVANQSKELINFLYDLTK